MKHRTIAAQLDRSRSEVILLGMLFIVLIQLVLPVPDHSLGRVILLVLVLYCMAAGGIAVLLYILYLNAAGNGPRGGDKETTPHHCGVVHF